MTRRSFVRTGAILALTSWATGPVKSQSCDLQIRDGQAATDIARIHRCLNDRLNRLESARPSAGEASPTATASNRNPPEFDAKTFSVSVQSARRQGNGVVIVLLLRSKADKEMHLALDQERGQELMDVAAAHHETIKEGQGIRTANSGMYDNNFTLVPARSTLNFVIRFGSGFTSASANLTLNIYEYTGRQHRRVAAPMTVAIAS